MHYLIAMVVKANTEAAAIETAKGYADDLVQRGDFDWYNMQPERWEDVGKAYKLDTEEGQARLAKSMSYTREEFNRNLEAARYMLENYTDDQIYNERFTHTYEKGNPNNTPYHSRSSFYWLAGYGNSVNAYNETEPIINDKQLDYLPDSAWVVMIDFHN